MRAITVRNVFLFAIAFVLVACSGEDGGAPAQPDTGQGTAISSLQLTPANSRIPVGFGQQLTALALMNDGTVTDVTNTPRLIWSSSAPEIATIDSKGLVTGVTVGNVTITAAGTNASGQRVSATALVTVTDAVVTALQVTPTTASVPIGLMKTYVATALFSDGSTLDVTHFSGLSWSSSAASIATISNASDSKGHATGLAVGNTDITASGIANGTPFSATAILTVTDAVITALQVTPATTSLAKGLTRQYTAIATLSDRSTVDVTYDPALSWSSSNTDIVTVGSAGSNNGLATGVNVGAVTITASGSANDTPFSATATLTVTDAVVAALQVTPATTSVAKGLTRQYTALATLSDGSTVDVTHDPALGWSSSNSGIATIGSAGNSNGLATGINPGAVTITASGNVNGTPFSATAILTVTDAVVTALQVTPATTSLAKGLTRQYTAIATLSDGSTVDVTHDPALNWSSSDNTIAIVSSGQKGDLNGKALGVDVGSATITASGTTNGTPFSATAILTVTDAVITALQVTPATTSLAKGLTRQYTAIATLSDRSTVDVTHDPALSWSSSNTSIATVGSAGNDNGLATGVNPGAVTITASGDVNGTLFSATAILTVTDAVVTALQVTPAATSVAKGLTRQYTAIATLSDGSTVDVTNDPVLSWSSSDNTIAIVSTGQKGDLNGKVLGVDVGSATITASGNANGTPFSATATLTVTDAIVTALQVTPATTSIAKGLTRQYTAIATLSDGSTVDVTHDPALNWSSSDNTIAIVSSGQKGDLNGKALGVDVGSATITASGTTNGTPFSATAILTVTDAVITALQVTPASTSVGQGLDRQYTALAILSDGSTVNVTNDPKISWGSSNTNIATVGSAGSNNGLATGVNLGSVSITANSINSEGTSLSASATLNVLLVTAIQVTPDPVTLPKDREVQMTATVTYSDQSTQDVTHDAQISWVSSLTTIATVSASGPTAGLAIGFNQGSCTLTASGILNGGTPFSASARADVITSKIASVRVEPMTALVGPGLSLQFSAIGTTTDGFDADITNDSGISWSSSNTSVATVGTAGINNGLATGVSPGIVTISASAIYQGVSYIGTATLTVSP